MIVGKISVYMICSKCHNSKSELFFSKNARSKTGLMRWCKDCVAVYDKVRYPKDKPKIRANTKRYIQRNRQYLRQIKTDSICVDCGENDPVVLEFDHLNNKIGNIADVVGRAWGIEKIRKEMAKCEIVCANCHRRRTFKRRNLGVAQR